MADGAWTALSVTGSSGPVCRSMDDKAGQMHTQSRSEMAHRPPLATPPGLGGEGGPAGHTGQGQSSAFPVAEATTCTSGRPHLGEHHAPSPLSPFPLQRKRTAALASWRHGKPRPRRAYSSNLRESFTRLLTSAYCVPDTPQALEGQRVTAPWPMWQWPLNCPACRGNLKSQHPGAPREDHAALLQPEATQKGV